MLAQLYKKCIPYFLKYCPPLNTLDSGINVAPVKCGKNYKHTTLRFFYPVVTITHSKCKDKAQFGKRLKNNKRMATFIPGHSS